MLAQSILPVLLFLAGAAQATVSVSPAEATKIVNDENSFQSSVNAAPSVASLLAEVTSYIGGPAAASSLGKFTYTDVLGFATNPGGYLSARPTSWETALPSSVRSAYDSLETSVILAQASILKQDLGLSNAAPTAGPALWGMAAGIAGVAGVAAVIL